MNKPLPRWLVALLLTATGPALAAETADPLTRPMQCARCAAWNEPVAPFRIHGNTWYVGVRGLSSVLIRTSAGLVLLDGDLAQSAPLIEANIRALGLRLEDLRLILNSHAHFDHAGGIAALQRDSGAVVAASPSGAAALRLGHAVADDPQAGWAAEAGFPPVAKVREVADGEVLKLGEVAITAHFTPGHTPGSTTWTWQSCEAQRCLNLVYADSLNAVAAPGFRFLGDQNHPDVSRRLRASIARVAALPCDVLVTVHPEQGGLWDKLAARNQDMQPDPFVAPDACKTYAAGADQLLDERLARERAESAR
jgi:metallo-beta-lactamase class B